MAFIDTNFGDKFLNVTQRVGKTGAFDDMLFVQVMLKFLFTESLLLKRINPIKGPISVTGQPAKDTPILIAAFQRHIMKRAKPEGFINRAKGSDKQKLNFTIVQMDAVGNTLLAANRINTQFIDFINLLSPFPLPTNTTP